MGKKKGKGRGKAPGQQEGAGPSGAPATQVQPPPAAGRGRAPGQQEGAGPSTRPATQVQPLPAPGHGVAPGPQEGGGPSARPATQVQSSPAAVTTPSQAPPARTQASQQPATAVAQVPQAPTAWGRKPVQPAEKVPVQQVSRAPPGFQAAPVKAPEPVAQAVAAKKPVALVGATADVEQTLERLSLTIKKPYEGEKPMPARPGYGKEGRKIQVKSNHYPLNIPDGYIYHYDVEIEMLRPNITPEQLAKEVALKATPQQVSGKRLSAAISREVMVRLFQREAIFNGVIPAYDGNKNMFTRKPIQTGKRLTKTVTFREEGRDIDSNFKVSIQPVSKDKDARSSVETNAINLNCLHQLFRGQCSFNVDCYQAIMALDIIMRHGPSLKVTSVGRSFFLKPQSQQEVPIGDGKEIWFGHYQTIRPDQCRPVLIVDKATKPFYGSGSLTKYACELLGKNNLVKLNDYETKMLTNDLRNVQICVTHLPYRRKYRIVRITTKSALELKFPETQASGKVVETSVAEYFRKTYKALQNPNLPCVQVNPEHKKIYQPMEVCELVEGQHYKRKLTEDQTSQMIKFTCTTPKDRFDDIQRSYMQTMEDSKRLMNEFGLKMDRQPLHLEGRVLDAPAVVYGQNKTIRPENGSWDLRGTKFLRGAVISSWAILSLAGDRFCTVQHLQHFAGMVQDMGNRMDMRISPPKAIMHLGNRGLPKVLEEMKRQHNLELLVIVLRDRHTYSEIKQVAEVKLGLRTSCIQSNNVVKKCNPNLVCNILLKMNAKFDGQNSKLQEIVMVPILGTPVLIIGVDVSHSAPGDKVRPSVAAAVGSLDRSLNNYAAFVKVQRSRNEDKQHIEVIKEFKDMVKNLLKAFFKNTKLKPEKIIVYRDGVSEGEFATVCDYEVPQVDAACLDIQKDGNYMPPVTFIVVQKRHHTRFAPENPREGVGRAGNVPPGTTVDKEVIHPVYHDFFLCSHFGIQGTSRPAHYTVLRDDSKLSADELQKMSYHLCHTYARCTRSISLPAPVMYAHLAALRARQHLASLARDDVSTTSDESEPSLDSLQRSQENVQVATDISMKMYYI